MPAARSRKNSWLVKSTGRVMTILAFVRRTFIEGGVGPPRFQLSWIQRGQMNSA
jgi:hypothetical protein